MWDDRESRRTGADAEVLFYRHGVPAGSGKVRNVSLDGLFLETNTPDLDRDDHVELEYRSLSGTRIYRFDALVVHRSEDGIGLFVERDDRRVADGIRALMGIHKRIHH
ncbi:PilZ domain-containing protein [Thiohalomonas denitrificans]|uniref:PilZ domain-containing protein n=1 Tax=Thiohalomonas denitrificans TaxID=415747 RepID=A0A1G5Q191_9GAMM|nr:PilZ domain-containing protein [Thiohalomonas denitrificans]SCZ55645.1 PilZ domain-containing protein [Thiohalomonas denitrificans]